jgi:hypothetical protein
LFVPMLQNYRGLVLKFDFLWGDCCDRDTVGLARGQCDATPRGLTQCWLGLSVCRPGREEAECLTLATRLDCLWHVASGDWLWPVTGILTQRSGIFR